MALYDWKCTRCDVMITVMHPHAQSDIPPTEAEIVEEKAVPKCLNTELPHNWKRWIGKTSFQLVGRGWSSDGYS